MSIAISLRGFYAAVFPKASTSITSMKTLSTTDWKTYRFFLHPSTIAIIARYQDGLNCMPLARLAEQRIENTLARGYARLAINGSQGSKR